MAELKALPRRACCDVVSTDKLESLRENGSRNSRLIAVPVLCLLSLCPGCAFDVVRLTQSPTQYEAVPATGRTWTLHDDLKVTIASGWATPLRQGTNWRQVGKIKEGDVLKTTDQIVTVEASNLFEAYPVVERGSVVGFFLPVENSFTPADPPAPINLLPID
jgi:hypothetical protein